MPGTQITPCRVKRNGERVAPMLVSGGRFALHFGVTRQYVDQLAQQGVIERLPTGLFDQGRSRLRYFEHLRSQHRRSPRAEAGAQLAAARAEWLQVRTLERKKELVPVELLDQTSNEIAGATLVAFSSLPAPLSPHGLAERRRCEAIIFQVRKELAIGALRHAETLEAALAATEPAEVQTRQQGADNLHSA
jgi:hypothetical protein